MNVDARTLYEQLTLDDAPLVLDVRNEDEFSRWKIEAASPVDLLNLPYFAFLEDEDESVSRVTSWIGGRARRLVVVCAKGGSSEFVADLLRGRGIASENLDGGMIAWGKATSWRALASSPVRAWQVVRFGKGCISYVLASGGDALVVDPHQGVEEYRAFLRSHDLVLRAVFDTHLHADHLSGGPSLAALDGVPYFANALDFEGAGFAVAPILDGARIQVGDLALTPLVFTHAPGHTPGSTALLVDQALLLTGDTLFVGSVGRPDLAGKAAEWGADLYRTLHVRLAGLPASVVVLPAHTAGPHEARPDGTIGEALGVLRGRNTSLLLDERSFLREVETSLAPAPAAYAAIRRVNLGIEAASEDERNEMEIGKNECAIARRHDDE